MRLLRLAGEGFRNLAPFSLGLDVPFVVFHGPNGQGKTNTLEAVYTLATLRPLRGHVLRDVVAWDAEQAGLSADVRSDSGLRQHRLELGARRRVWVDGSEVRDLAEHFDTLRVVAFQPIDGRIITDEPALRRAWLDRAAFTARPSHLGRVRSYLRVLSQKAAALREGTADTALLDVLDTQLAEHGGALVAARVALLEALRPHVAEEHATLAGPGACIELSYRGTPPSVEVQPVVQALTERLRASRGAELRRRQCLVGPHRDDVSIELDGQSARTFGSRGQVRSIVLALKLAELAAARSRGEQPIFLLDDLSSELDRARTARLVQRLAELSAQVFITTTDPEHVSGLPKDALMRVAVDGGALKPA